MRDRRGARRLARRLICARAGSYPNRAVRVVVPWPPGQATDIAARVVAQKLQESLGQPFVIDNRPGAGGSIGTDIVAKSTADGYTLLAASSGPLSIMPNLQKIAVRPAQGSRAGEPDRVTPFALVTHPSFPATNAKEFIALVKANPGKYTFSSSGTGATAHLFDRALQLVGAASRRATCRTRAARPRSPTS